MTVLKGKHQEKNLTEFYKRLPSDRYAQSKPRTQGQHQESQMVG